MFAEMRKCLLKSGKGKKYRYKFYSVGIETYCIKKE